MRNAYLVVPRGNLGEPSAIGSSCPMETDMDEWREICARRIRYSASRPTQLKFILAQTAAPQCLSASIRPAWTRACERLNALIAMPLSLHRMTNRSSRFERARIRERSSAHIRNKMRSPSKWEERRRRRSLDAPSQGIGYIRLRGGQAELKRLSQGLTAKTLGLMKDWSRWGLE
jgi:hypothetical protein